MVASLEEENTKRLMMTLSSLMKASVGVHQNVRTLHAACSGCDQVRLPSIYITCNYFPLVERLELASSLISLQEVREI